MPSYTFLAASSSNHARAGSTSAWTGAGDPNAGNAGQTALAAGASAYLFLLAGANAPTIPVGESVVGVSVQLALTLRQDDEPVGGPTPLCVCDALVLVQGGSALTGDRSFSGWTGATARTAGGSSDLWGATPARTDINSTFGVAIAAYCSGSATQALVGAASFTVYTAKTVPPPPPTGGDGKAFDARLRRIPPCAIKEH